MVFQDEDEYFHVGCNDTKQAQQIFEDMHCCYANDDGINIKVHNFEINSDQDVTKRFERKL